MRKDKIAVIGDRDTVLVFKAVGAEIFSVYSDEEAITTLKNLAKNFKVILITDDIAERISSTIARYVDKAYPIVVPIPSSNGSSGYGIECIKKNVEKAIGVDILFNREDD